MAQRLNRYEKSKLRQFENLLSKGLNPAQANRIVKETSSTNPERRKGIRPEIANRYAQRFSRQSKTTMQGFPTRRSERLLSSRATPTVMRSNPVFGHRYLLEIQFEARNPVTGMMETFHNTIGLQRLDRWGRIEDMIKERIIGLEANSEHYFVTGFVDPVMDSIRVNEFLKLNQ